MPTTPQISPAPQQPSADTHDLTAKQLEAASILTPEQKTTFFTDIRDGNINGVLTVLETKNLSTGTFLKGLKESLVHPEMAIALLVSRSDDAHLLIHDTFKAWGVTKEKIAAIAGVIKRLNDPSLAIIDNALTARLNEEKKPKEISATPPQAEQPAVYYRMNNNRQEQKKLQLQAQEELADQAAIRMTIRKYHADEAARAKEQSELRAAITAYHTKEAAATQSSHDTWLIPNRKPTGINAMRISAEARAKQIRARAAKIDVIQM